ALNRIVSGSSAANTGALSWGENYAVDSWGNLTISPMPGKAHGGNFQCPGDIQNHATCLGYDIAGNMISNGTAAYTYDAGDTLKTVGTISYLYDVDGQRFAKWDNGVPVKSYFYGANGEVLAEGAGSSNLTAEYIYFNGKRVARVDLPANTVHYYLSDHLNSTSMVVSATGGIEEESDYSPFGTEYVVTGPGITPYKFTGKERDSESGLDYFGARYYSGTSGRWMSPDPVGLSREPQSPQTLNKFSYCFNNPLGLTDPDGKWPTWFHHRLIDDDLHGDLSSSDITIVEHASDWVDSFEHQAPEYSFMHDMRDGIHNQTQQQAEAETQGYVTNELSAAVTDQINYEKSGGKGFNEDALTHFGHALHTVQDGTSPEHQSNKPWFGIFTFNALNHFVNEGVHAFYALNLPGSDMEADEAAYNANIQTVFFWNRFQNALASARKKEKKKKREIPSGLDLAKDQSGYGIH
ncbi:MAG: RHS repeat-associated core domain-containing protein, partial [Candidatus Angelobacter sp.]